MTMFVDPLANWGAANLGPRFVGPYIQLAFGTVALSFLSGALWAFAARARGMIAATAHIFAVIPALWAFLLVGGGPASAGIYLLAGFLGTLALDFMFWAQGLAPRWWMRLRLVMTIVAALTLLPIVI